MTHFYASYAQSGNKRSAFHAARKKVKAKYPEPFYWGAFVLVGH